jgi:hypothetical protein
MLWCCSTRFCSLLDDLAIVLRYQGRGSEAKAVLPRVLRFDPTSATAHRLLDEDANVLKP